MDSCEILQLTQNLNADKYITKLEDTVWLPVGTSFKTGTEGSLKLQINAVQNNTNTEK